MGKGAKTDPEAGHDAKAPAAPDTTAAAPGPVTTTTSRVAEGGAEDKETPQKTASSSASGSSFLNLRPPSDSPARANCRITFGKAPSVEQFSLPIPLLQRQKKDSDRDTDAENGGGVDGEDEHTHAKRKRPRAASPPRALANESGSTERRKASAAADAQPGKKRILTAATSTQESHELTVAIIKDMFDPVTFAHLQLAAELIHNEVADEVWLMPGASSVAAAGKLSRTPCRERWLMCHLAVNSVFGSDFPVKVHAEAMDAARLLSRAELLGVLKRQHPRIHFRFVISSDEIGSRSKRTGAEGKSVGGQGSGKTSAKHKEHAPVVVPLVVVPQPGFPCEAWARGHADCIIFDSGEKGVHFPFSQISSSTVRQRAKLACASIRDVQLECISSKRESDSSEPLRARLKRSLSKHKTKSLTCCEGLLPAPVLRHIEKYDLCNKYF